MNSLIGILNQRAEDFSQFAWPMLWQSSLLIVGLFTFEYLFRRKIHASIRYALWVVVLVKLCVPPSLALPTSPAWWLHKPSPPAVAKSFPHYTVTYDDEVLLEIPSASSPVFVTTPRMLTNAAWLLVASAVASLALFGLMLVRWYQITQQIRRAKTSERLSVLAGQAQKIIGTKFKVKVKLTTNSMSPAVCGLFRPTILIPQTLAGNFLDEQLHAVLLHELFHLRRRDVWLNFVQALLQIFYWWHPLVWLANARIRRVREEAVDDAVMLALRDDAESYAPTLLEVAKLALNPPLASLGLVGILEPRHALRQRIERLMDFHPPCQAGLTLVSLLGILAFTAVAVPMGDGPSSTEPQTSPASPVSLPMVAAQNTNADLITVTGMTNQWHFFVVTNSLGFTNAAFITFLSQTQGMPRMGISNDPNFRLVMNALKQRSGSETLVEPEVVTTSGHDVNRIRTDNISALLAHPASESSNQLAMTFKLSHPMRQDELKENFLAAGVRIPPTIFYYNENGMLLVRSSEEQLALVNRMVLELNGYSPEEIQASDKQFPEQISEIRREVNSGTNLLNRHFRVDTATFSSALRKTPGLQTNSDSTMAKSLLRSFGVDWESPPGKSIFYNDRLGGLFVKATLTDLDTVERALEVIQSAETNKQTMTANRESFGGTNSNVVNQTNFSTGTNVVENKIEAGTLVQDAKLYYEMGKLDDAEKLLKSALSLDTENNGAKYYLGLVQAARQAPKLMNAGGSSQGIIQKLETIRLDRVAFEAVPLGEVFRTLAGESKKLDPDGRGFNFLINPNAGQIAAPTIDPSTGLPIAPNADYVSKLGSIPITINPPLTNIGLGDVLDALVLVAPEPIHYSIEDYAIVIRSGKLSVPLYNLNFRVDTNRFIGALHMNTGMQTNSVSAMARIYFSTLGLDWDSPKGKSIFYNDRLGTLFIRATQSDLDLIEPALSQLNLGMETVPNVPFLPPIRTNIQSTNASRPRIHIQARFLEVPKGTSDVLKNVITITNLNVRANQVAGLVGILMDKKLKAVLHDLEVRPDVETLAEPEVVTTSGRQTQVRATVVQTVITNFAFQKYMAHSTTNGIQEIVTNAVFPQASQIETGPVLSAIPYVLADGHTINLTLKASMTEFFGYDQPQTNAVGKYIKEYDVTLPVILPSFHIEEASTQINLWDGQTVVVGKLRQHFYTGDKEVGAEPDYFVKTKKFRGQSDTMDRELLIFITATIVDRDGIRIHPDEPVPADIYDPIVVPSDPSRLF